jgi:hypothetical protein
MPIEMRVMFLELSDHPERIQRALDDMTAGFQKAQAEAAKKKGR